jgi:hypothetical protein
MVMDGNTRELMCSVGQKLLNYLYNSTTVVNNSRDGKIVNARGMECV